MNRATLVGAAVMQVIPLILAAPRIVSAEGYCPAPFVAMLTDPAHPIDRNENQIICITWHEAGPHDLKAIMIDDH